MNQRALRRTGLRLTVLVSLFLAMDGGASCLCSGGAVATHARIGSPLGTLTLFGVYLGIALWAALWCRLPALRVQIPFRKGE